MAMEVSTKCQLDTSVVWSAWGMACLRCGQLDKAREKLKHCFQVGQKSVKKDIQFLNARVSNTTEQFLCLHL